MQRNRGEYGDWQTNYQLAKQVCQLLKESGVNPQTIIEPTCGEGSFIFAALEVFVNISKVYAIDIYRPYIDIVEKKKESYVNVEFHIVHEDIFIYDLTKIEVVGELLILGNPPWVTNSKLGDLGSKNLPTKSNFKSYLGIDAITGKGNFDIAEYILLKLIATFAHYSGNIALLVKNSVIKNLITDKSAVKFGLGDISQFEFDAKKEFGASTSASLFFAKFGVYSQNICSVYDLYSRELYRRFGMSKDDMIIYDMDLYVEHSLVDGHSQLEWRSGVKHDCSKVMELERSADRYTNGYGDSVELEHSHIYPIIKSSDIKDSHIDECRRYVIITQKATGEATDTLATHAPKLFKYLNRYSTDLNNRKSIIYKKRPPFSIFGVGDYSFKPYKIVISALYKRTKFSLLSLIENRVAVVDDTCYSIGFDDLRYAIITQKILNSEMVQDFIRSVSFKDAKRPINKDLLMRIDILSVAKMIGHKELNVDLHLYECYLNWLRQSLHGKKMVRRVATERSLTLNL